MSTNEELINLTRQEIKLLIDLAIESKLFYNGIERLSCKRIKELAEELKMGQNIILLE